MLEWYVKSQHCRTLVYTLSKYAVNLDPVWLCMNCKQEVDTITVLFTQTPSELQSSPDIHHLWHRGQFSKVIRWTQSSSCPLCVHQAQVHGDKRISPTVYKHTVNVFHAIFTRVKTDACSIHVPYCQNKLLRKEFLKGFRWKMKDNILCDTVGQSNITPSPKFLIGPKIRKIWQLSVQNFTCIKLMYLLIGNLASE